MWGGKGTDILDAAQHAGAWRHILVLLGAGLLTGAGMGAAYGVPLGGALFSLEVMRGMLALRYVLPTLIAAMVATAVSWLALPDVATYIIPAYSSSASCVVWALLVGPIAGVVSVVYVRAITWADRNKPRGWQRLVAPVIVLGALGVLSIWFPQLLGNGKDISQLAFTNQAAPFLLLALLALKPLATVLCMRSGAPGGLFTPTLTAGAMLGAVLGTHGPGSGPVCLLDFLPCLERQRFSRPLLKVPSQLSY